MSRGTSGRSLPAPPPPRAAPELLGHAGAEAAVRRWIAIGSLPHALLISGTWGIGKATFAYRIAHALLADSARGGAEGEASRWIAAGTHPGLLSIERKFDEKRGRTASEIVIDDIRRIRAFLSASAAIGGWRVVILDAADEMNTNAANALLKVLEEPGRMCLILLIAHRPAMLPATIRSRCRPLPLQPLPQEVLAELLLRMCPEREPQERQTLAALAEGSIGRALLLAGHDGLAAFRFFSRFFTALAGRDTRESLPRIAEAGSLGDEDSFLVHAHMLMWWLRRITRAGSGEQLDPVGNAAEDRADAVVVARLAGALALDRWLQVWEKSQRLLAQAANGNLDRKQALTAVLLNLHSELWTAGA